MLKMLGEIHWHRIVTHHVSFGTFAGMIYKGCGFTKRNFKFSIRTRRLTNWNWRLRYLLRNCFYHNWIESKETLLRIFTIVSYTKTEQTECPIFFKFFKNFINPWITHKDIISEGNPRPLIKQLSVCIIQRLS